MKFVDGSGCFSIVAASSVVVIFIRCAEVTGAGIPIPIDRYKMMELCPCDYSHMATYDGDGRFQRQQRRMRQPAQAPTIITIIRQDGKFIELFAAAIQNAATQFASSAVSSAGSDGTANNFARHAMRA